VNQRDFQLSHVRAAAPDYSINCARFDLGRDRSNNIIVTRYTHCRLWLRCGFSCTTCAASYSWKTK